jgi:hypothetical protein
MAILTTLFELNAINPDGSDNTFLPSIAPSAIPTAESIDWAAMGMLLKLTIYVEISSTYSDGSTADLVGASIVYNPGLFKDVFSNFVPPGTLPLGGYILQVPSSTPTVYSVPLSGQGTNANSNDNGTCTIEIISSKICKIVHIFRVISDVEDYVIGKKLDNWTRLSKASNYSTSEGSEDRPSAFGYPKAINAVVGVRQRGFTTIQTPELSIPFSASFNGYQSDSSASVIPFTYEIERLSVPGTVETSLSPFEPNLIKLIFEDAGSIIADDETSVIIAKRNLDQNINTFSKDFLLEEIKLIATGSTAQISVAFYGPVIYDHTAGITTISFVIDGTELEKDIFYQIHADAGYNRDPSDNALQHVMTEKVRTDGAPRKVDFTMGAEFWTRNALHAESFTALAGERITSVLTINRAQYDSNALPPFLSFNDDVDTVSVKIYTAQGLIDDDPFFVKFIQKNLTDTFDDTAFISNDVTNDPSDADEVHFWLNSFRIPFENFQGLDNWIGQTLTFRWSIRFLDQTNPTFGAIYYADTELTIRGYENDEPSPASDVVSNIQFRDPATGDLITNWCDMTSILVTADIEDLGATTYVQVMVDKFPLGVLMYNDYALTESDPETHTLPAWVEILSESSPLVSQLDSEPTDGNISFLLDISGLSDEEKMRIFIQAYRA